MFRLMTRGNSTILSAVVFTPNCTSEAAPQTDESWRIKTEHSANSAASFDIFTLLWTRISPHSSQISFMKMSSESRQESSYRCCDS